VTRWCFLGLSTQLTAFSQGEYQYSWLVDLTSESYSMISHLLIRTPPFAASTSCISETSEITSPLTIGNSTVHNHSISFSKSVSARAIVILLGASIRWARRSQVDRINLTRCIINGGTSHYRTQPPCTAPIFLIVPENRLILFIPPRGMILSEKVSIAKVLPVSVGQGSVYPGILQGRSTRVL